MKRDVAAEDLGEEPPVLLSAVHSASRDVPLLFPALPTSPSDLPRSAEIFLVRLAEVHVVGLGPLESRKCHNTLLKNSIFLYSLAV